MGVLKACVGLSAALILLFNLPANTVISFFSRISFSLYLTHDVIGSKFVVYAGTLAPKTIYWKGTIFLVGIAVSIGAAYLFYLMCEKPFLNLSKSYVYNKQRRE
jgi:peptidoglycan/LPS O-acetylase OafA/YrhL